MLSMFTKRAQTTEASAVALDKQTVEYVSTDSIFPGQLRFSELNTLEKVAKLKKKGFVLNEQSKTLEPKHHKGKSLFAKKDALPVIHTSFGYVLLDGHHDVISSLRLNAKMIPIKVVQDLRHLSVNEFWAKAEKEELVYLLDKDGTKKPAPTTFSALIDDSNRYFAAIVARKYFEEDGVCDSKGAEFPVWIKMGKDIPFIEFKIANALFAKGFIYDPIKMGNPPKPEIIEQARKILQEANIPGLRLITSLTHYQQIKVDFKSKTLEIEYNAPSLKH